MLIERREGAIEVVGRVLRVVNRDLLAGQGRAACYDLRVTRLKQRIRGGGGQFFVSSDDYLGLLNRMARRVDIMQPRPDCVVGVIRSGLFPAVYLSHQLRLPFFCATNIDDIPVKRLRHPLLVDTSVWSGGTMRRLQCRLQERGFASAAVFAMYVRNFPRPQVDELHFLETSDHIMQFWYDIEGLVQEIVSREQAAQGTGPD